MADRSDAGVICTVDVGTSSTKAAIYRGALDRGPVITRPGGAIAADGTVDLRRLTADATAALRDAVESAGAAGSVRALALTTIYGHVFLDAAGEPLLPGLAWSHRAAAEQVAPVVAAYRAAGNEPDRGVGPALLAPRLLWLRTAYPQHYRRLRRVVGIKDFLLHQLTGTWITDPSQLDYSALTPATVTELFGATPPWHRGDADLLTALFPPVGRVYDRGGTLRSAAATATGIPAGCPVVVGTSDGGAAVHGAGVLAPGTIAGVTGSTDVLMVHRPEGAPRGTRSSQAAARRGLAANAAVDGGVLYGGSTGTAGAAIAWIDGLLTAGRREWWEVAPGAEGIRAAPGLTGERAPFPGAGAATLVGLTAAHDGAAIARALREAVCFRFAALADAIAAAAAESPAPADRVVVGGGGHDPRLDAIRSASLSLPFFRVPDAQVSLRGSAMFARAAVDGGDPVETLRELAQETVAGARRIEAGAATDAGYPAIRDAWVRWMDDRGGDR